MARGMERIPQRRSAWMTQPLSIERDEYWGDLEEEEDGD